MNAYVSQLELKFGSASTIGSLFGIKCNDNVGKYKRCTPDGERVNQVYRDPAGNIYELDELKLGELDPETGKVKVVEEADIKAAKESRLPLNVLEVTAHDKNDIEDYLFPSGNQAYVFKPQIKKGSKVIDDPINTQWYDFINTILRETDTALVGLCNLKNHEGLFRLGRYQGYITLQKQLYPEELNIFDRWNSTLELKVRDKAGDISRRAVKGFEPKAYKNEVKERLGKLTTVKGAVPTSRSVQTDKASEFSMLEALEEFVV